MGLSKRIFIHILFITAVVLTAVGINGASDASYAAVNDKADGVYFEEPYAYAGEDLTVKYDGSETSLTYKWYVNDEPASYIEDEALIITEDHYEKTVKAEIWSGGTKLGEASMFCSKLPVLYIDTEGGAEVVTKEYYLDAEMHLQGNTLYNEENTTLYSGVTEIKGRGNSTWNLFPKKPYRLKLDKKTDLFGLGKDKNWVLLANYIDESNMRNMLAGEIATRMGVGAMDGTWVELVMNGKPQGTYMLCEHVRLSEDRVNVFDWEEAAEDIAEAIAEAKGLSEDDMDALTDQMVEEDMSWISTGEVTYGGVTYKTADYYEDLPESFSGGWLMEMDYGYDEVSKFTTANGATLMFKSPEFICTDETAMESVQSYIQTFEDAMYSPDHCTEVDGTIVSYTDFCDVDSMVNFWLASELLMNEIGCKSTYFQKDIDQPIEFGPVWDFDFSSGSVSPFTTQNQNDWTSDNKYWNATQEKWWFNHAMQDPYFAVKAREAYLDQAAYLKSVIADGGQLEQWYEYLKEAGDFNYELWKYAGGFDADYEKLQSWLTERINWIDKQFLTNESAVKSMRGVLSSKLSLSLKGDGLVSNGNKAYRLEDGYDSFDLNVTVKEAGYTELNYYINSKYQGTVPITDNKASIVIREEQLTEDIGDDNVITVWLTDQQGQPEAQQFVTVELTSNRPLYNVVYNEITTSYSDKVVAGEKVYVKGPKVQEKETVFEGWTDGENVYKAGDWFTVNSDMNLEAVWVPCSYDTNMHNFVEEDDVYKCINEGCNVTKSTGKTYRNVSAVVLTCSNRYENYYTGQEIKPTITMTAGTNTLVEGQHYSLEYKNNINVGYATYTIKGIKAGGYTGEYSLSYRILPREVSKASVTLPKSSVLVDGGAQPEATLKYNGITLVEGVDYTVSYSNNTAIGTGKVTFTGIGNFTGTSTKTFKVIAPPKEISKCTFGTVSTQGYTGKAVKPSITVKNGSKKLTAGTHYTVTYSNNTKCGTASMTIKGVEDNGFKGSKTVKFKIRPAKPGIKVTNVSYNQQKVTWSKVAGVTKYNVYRSTDNKNFKHVKSVKPSADRVYKSKGLDTGRTYYYRVRAVKVVEGDEMSTTYWGIKSKVVKAKPVLHKSTIKSAENTASGAAKIKWSGINGAHGYKLYRSTTGKSGTYKLVKTNMRGNKSYTDKNLTIGKKYYYKVKAYRKVDGKMVYGATSAAKTVKISE